MIRRSPETTRTYSLIPYTTLFRSLRKNVRFYRDADAAERDGLRPCKRCDPQRHRSDNEAMRIAEVCRYIEAHADTKLPLAALAQRAQLSPFHFKRRFKAIVGLSPKEYSEA